MKKSLIFLTLSAIGLSSASAVVTATNLLAYYDFDGQAEDQSGNGADATLAGGAVLTGAGRIGGGLDLGVSSNSARADATVDFSSATANDAMAVSFWQFDIGNGAGGNAATTAFGMLSTGAPNRGFQAHTPWSDGTLYFDHGGPCCGGNNRLTTGVGTSLLDGWHHIVLQVNGDTKEIWVDGVMANQQISATLAAIPDFTGALMIGAEPAGTNNGFGGRIDEFAVWNTSLDANDIAALAGGAATPTIIVPEPSASLFALLGCLLIFRRRR